MIERCAEALFKQASVGHTLYGTTWEKVTNKDMWKTSVLTVIKAMREPTEKILGAIHGCYPDVPNKYASTIAKQRWEAAIDAVIND